MFDTPLDELKSQVQELGLRFETDELRHENDAEVYLGDEKLCDLTFDEVEGSWHVEDFPPFVCPRVEVPSAIESRLREHLAEKKRAARQMTFTVTIEYGGDVAKPTAEAERALANLVAESIRKLGPTKPKPKAVVVNGRRHSLRRPAKSSR